MADDRKSNGSGKQNEQRERVKTYDEYPCKGGVEKPEKNSVADPFPPPNKKPKK